MMSRCRYGRMLRDYRARIKAEEEENCRALEANMLSAALGHSQEGGLGGESHSQIPNRMHCPVFFLSCLSVFFSVFFSVYFLWLFFERTTVLQAARPRRTLGVHCR